MTGSCRCGAQWTAACAAHCPTCHTTYPTVSAFDAHRAEKLCMPGGQRLALFEVGGGANEGDR